eukprot:PhF_6_TR24801/c0_g1_i1/m.34118/K14685/SLC40A1, FPN1; solute carrier family 40 (iron-regulated transporter), member 1
MCSSLAFFLYASRVFSQIGNRLFQFVLPMTFIVMWSDTFMPTAIMSFSAYIVHFFVLPFCGNVLDTSNKIVSATVLIIAKNVFFAAACFSLNICFYSELGDEPIPQFTKGYVGFGFACLFTIAAETAEEAWTLSVERNWVVLIAGEDQEMLATFNVVIRRIDLLCLTFAPLLMGFALQNLTDPRGKISFNTFIMATYCVLSTLPELIVTRTAYYKSEALMRDDARALPEAPPPEDGSSVQPKDPIRMLVHSWRKYGSHTVFHASIAYSMIYFTVLDGGSLMLSYLKWVGIPETVI